MIDNEKAETEAVLKILGTRYILERHEDVTTDVYKFILTDSVTRNVEEFSIKRLSFVDLNEALVRLRQKIENSIQQLKEKETK